MKTFVHFSSGGTIHSVVMVDAPDGVTAMLQPDAGQMVAEVEAPELASASKDNEVEKLRELIKQYKVMPSNSPVSRLEKVKAP
jgi:predicted ArsR family transcriptional regulator